jgi:hypothetical protein
MNYAQSLLEGILGGIENRVTTGISSLKISFNNVFGLLYKLETCIKIRFLQVD